MSSLTTYDGIRQVNSIYHSVIEEVTAGLQTLFEDEKEEERKRLQRGLEKRLKEKKAELGKGKKRRKSKEQAAELADYKVEIKELEVALKKPPAKMFDPATVVTDFRHLWLQKLRTSLASQSVEGSRPKSTSTAAAGLSSNDRESSATAATTKEKTRDVKQTDGADSSEEEEEEDEEREDEDDGPDMEPLCSEDDMSDDPDAMFDCADVILCKSSEVKREKGGKWRIRLKEGVANLGGKDLLFKECHSDLLDFY